MPNVCICALYTYKWHTSRRFKPLPHRLKFWHSVYMKRTNVFLPEPMLEKLNALSEIKGVPVAELIRHGVDKFLDEPGIAEAIEKFLRRKRELQGDGQ